MFCNSFSKNRTVFLDNMEKYGTIVQATDGNMMWRMWFLYWVTNDIDTHSEPVILSGLIRQQ